MATQAIEQVDEAPPQNKGKRVVLFLALGGILAGGAAGALALGPAIAKRAAAKPAPAKTEAAKTDQAAVPYDMANLVLNPAGTGGTRFLMVTATFQLKDQNTYDNFKLRDSEVRDRILSVLGAKTIDELSTMDHRDGIKKEIVDSVSAMFPKGAILNLFLPQFVIQ